jgi:hypothetical protein
MLECARGSKGLRSLLSERYDKYDALRLTCPTASP